MADQDDVAPEILAVRQHLVSHLGAPADVVSIRGNPDPKARLQEIEVATFAPGGTDQPVVFATCGVSRIELADGRFVEGMTIVHRMPSKAHTEAIQRLLGSFALFVEQNTQPVGLGDVVRSKDDVEAFSDMEALVFMPPLPFVESFHEFGREDGGEVEMLWVLPVYEDEAQYALDHGPGPLMMLFAAQRLDLTYMKREEANTLVSPEDAAVLAELREKEAMARGEDGRPQYDDEPAPPPKPVIEVDPDAFAAFSASAGAVTIERKPKPKKAPPPPQVPEPPPRAESPPPDAAPRRARGSRPDRAPSAGADREPSAGGRGPVKKKRPLVKKKKVRKKKKVKRFKVPQDRATSPKPDHAPPDEAAYDPDDVPE